MGMVEVGIMAAEQDQPPCVDCAICRDWKCMTSTWQPPARAVSLFLRVSCSLLFFRHFYLSLGCLQVKEKRPVVFFFFFLRGGKLKTQSVWKTLGEGHEVFLPRPILPSVYVLTRVQWTGTEGIQMWTNATQQWGHDAAKLHWNSQSLIHIELSAAAKLRHVLPQLSHRLHRVRKFSARNWAPEAWPQFCAVGCQTRVHLNYQKLSFWRNTVFVRRSGASNEAYLQRGRGGLILRKNDRSKYFQISRPQQFFFTFAPSLCFRCYLHRHAYRYCGHSLVSGTLIFPCANGRCTHRGIYPGWPDEGRDKQRGQAEQKAQRALHVSGHDEEHRGGQPVVARINILLRGCKELLKKSKDELDVLKEYSSYQLLQNSFMRGTL